MFHWIDGRTFTLMRLQFCLNVIHNFLKYFLVPYSSMGYKHLKYGILISNWQHILFCLWVDSVFNYYKA
jgi:Na+-driven multidrug efflux pump